MIPLEVQEKILRVVEYGTYERVGSSKTHETNVRIVGATNADLPQLCREGKFKEDLLDRLSFEVLFLPPLRERGDDIILLANFFASRMAMECGRPDLPVLSDEVVAQLMSYRWPGNVRELKNVIERAVYRSDDCVISHVQFNPFENPYLGTAVEPDVQEAPVVEEQQAAVVPAACPLEQYALAKDSLDLEFLTRALQSADNNQKEAARLLGLTYDQFRGLYRKFKENLVR